MLTLIALLALSPVLLRATSLFAAMLNAGVETRPRHHTALRGLMTGALTGIIAGIAATFVNGGTLYVGLFVASIAAGLIWWRLAVRRHAIAFIANLACSHVLLMAFALVAVSSSLGRAGL
jgi:hypothetical protein